MKDAGADIRNMHHIGGKLEMIHKFYGIAAPAADAEFLEGHEKVDSVNYPGLASNRYHEAAKKFLPVSVGKPGKFFNIKYGEGGIGKGLPENSLCIRAERRLKLVPPGLASNRYHEAAKKYLPDGCSGVISFCIRGGRGNAGKFLKINREKRLPCRSQICFFLNNRLYPLSCLCGREHNVRLGFQRIPQKYDKVNAALHNPGANLLVTAQRAAILTRQ